jgi:hypothetical protein
MPELHREVERESLAANTATSQNAIVVSEAVVVYNNLVSGTGSLARGYANTMSGVEQLMRLGTPEGGEHQKRSG